MKKQRLDNANNPIIGHFNINSFRNKFVFVKDITKLFDVFLVSESNLDHTFRSNQYIIYGYKVFRLDHDRFGSGLDGFFYKQRFYKQRQADIGKKLGKC